MTCDCLPWHPTDGVPPGANQPVQDELVAIWDGSTTVFATLWPYNPQTLEIEVAGEGVEVDPTDWTTGAFTLVDTSGLSAGQAIVATYLYPCPPLDVEVIVTVPGDWVAPYGHHLTQFLKYSGDGTHGLRSEGYYRSEVGSTGHALPGLLGGKNQGDIGSGGNWSDPPFPLGEYRYIATYTIDPTATQVRVRGRAVVQGTDLGSITTSRPIPDALPLGVPWQLARTEWPGYADTSPTDHDVPVSVPDTGSWIPSGPTFASGVITANYGYAESAGLTLDPVYSMAFDQTFTISPGSTTFQLHLNIPAVIGATAVTRVSDDFDFTIEEWTFDYSDSNAGPTGQFGGWDGSLAIILIVGPGPTDMDTLVVEQFIPS